MEHASSDSSRLSFLDLPRELRDEVYQHLSVIEGAYLNPQDEGRLSRSTSLTGVSKQLEDEYYEVLVSLAPVITANVHDFNFSHINTFLSSLASKRDDETAISEDKLNPTTQIRNLKIILTLTPACRNELMSLRSWLEPFDSAPPGPIPTLSNFSTSYSLHTSAFAAMQSITVMRVMDVVYVDWFLHTKPGPMKREMGKLCDCLQALEEKVCGVVRR